MEPPPCSRRSRAYEGAWRCLGFSPKSQNPTPKAGGGDIHRAVCTDPPRGAGLALPGAPRHPWRTLTHSLTHTLTHSLSHTHSLTHSLAHSLTQSLTHSLPHCRWRRHSSRGVHRPPRGGRPRFSWRASPHSGSARPGRISRRWPSLLTHSLTHSLTYTLSLTHTISLTHKQTLSLSLSHSHTHTHSHTLSRTHSLTHTLSHTLALPGAPRHTRGARGRAGPPGGCHPSF